MATKKRKPKRTNYIGMPVNTMHLDSTIKIVALKFYDEQLPHGFDGLKKSIDRLSKDDIQILVIKHDKDTYAEDFWDIAEEKHHYHLIARVMDGKGNTSKNGIKLRTLMHKIDVTYRKGKDEELLKFHGAESVMNLANYCMYLTHETDQAIKDGKHIYNIEEIYSNLSVDEIRQLREGYVRLSDNHKTSYSEMVDIDEQAKKLGYELGDFDEWYHSLDLKIRANTKMRQAKESYYYGVRKRIQENDYVTRLCIFIQGEPNSGKTFSSREALKRMGYERILTVGGGGTGKFDNLRVTTQAIIVDDDKLPYALNMTDNKIVQAYRRGSNNPYWSGQLLVVTSNKTFLEWLVDCGIDNPEHITAMESRFYICSLENNNLKVSSVSKRGDGKAQEERLRLYKTFRDLFDEVIKDYIPNDIEIEYSFLNGKPSIMAEINNESSKIEVVEAPINGGINGAKKITDPFIGTMHLQKQPEIECDEFATVDTPGLDDLPYN